MDDRYYISLIYQNLKGKITTEEFELLSKATADNPDLAQKRLEIEDAWDATGELEAMVSPEQTEDLFHLITRKKEPGKPLIIRLVPYFGGVAAAILIAYFGFFRTASNIKIYDSPGLYSLIDGSEVMLREGELQVHRFNNKERRVVLNGEAIFDITEDANRPFSVVSNRLKVSVLGTRFLIKNRDSFQLVKLIEGRINAIDLESGKIFKMVPGMVIRQTQSGILEESSKYDNLTAWNSGSFIYRQKSLVEVIEELNLIYNQTIEIKNPLVLECKVSAVIQSNKLEEVLEYISSTFNMEIQDNAEGFILLGGTCD